MTSSAQLPEALSGLEPVPVWKYFHDLTQIPRASGNEKAAIEYIVTWAEENGFEWRKDDAGNLCVKVQGSEGYKGKEPVCLQGHIDMVPEKTFDKVHDFQKDPITTVRDGENIRADQTTLGADNGIGLAGAMAIATDSGAVHPPLELLITVNEETGFVGTFNLDLSKLGVTSSTLINLDNEQIGETGIQSAGLRMATGTRPIEREASAPAQEGTYYKLTLTDFPGGHSAKDIAAGIPNAIKVMASILKSREASARLVSITGGERINGIPITCEAIVYKARRDNQQPSSPVQVKIGEHTGTMKIETLSPEEITTTTMTQQTHSAILSALDGIPSGMDKKHPDFDIPFTSSNLGTVRMKNDGVEIGFSIRSPEYAEIDRVHTQITATLNENGFDTKVHFEIPTWNADPKSTLVACVNQAYEDVSGKAAVLGATHGGLEPSVIKDRLVKHRGGISVASVAFGPNIKNPHSPSELVNIKSVETFYGQLKRTLELLAAQ